VLSIAELQLHLLLQYYFHPVLYLHLAWRLDLLVHLGYSHVPFLPVAI